MLKWTIIFLVIALIAALLGFGGIAAGAAEIAEILFFLLGAMTIVEIETAAWATASSKKDESGE